MPRDVSRIRDQVGSSKKVAPSVDDPSTQLALNAVYKELNELKQAVSSTANTSQSRPSEGKDGDIRLYSKNAQDGTTGFYIQGKFGQNWASGRLGVDLIDPELADQVYTNIPTFEDNGGEYATKEDITFETLDENLDVGHYWNQVAKGDHDHTHLSLSDINAGNETHDSIDFHINDTPTVHRLTGDTLDTPTVGIFGATNNEDVTQGTATTWAKTDHQHKLDTDASYIWTSGHTFDPTGAEDAITAVGNVDITGDVNIIGNLNVEFAEEGTGNTTVDEDLTVGDNVILNNDWVDTSAEYTTIIKGLTTIENQLKVNYQPDVGESQLTLTYEGAETFDSTFTVSDQGLLVIDSGDEANMELHCKEAVLPKGHIEIDLGKWDRKWKTLWVAEIVAESLVAQEVMATIGGRIMVAPTTKLIQALNNDEATSTMYVEHNGTLAVGDYGFLKSAPAGIPMQEAVHVTAGPVATTMAGQPVAGGIYDGNAVVDAVDLLFPNTNIDARLEMTDAHGLEHGQWITIVDTNGDDENDWDGAYQVFLVDRGMTGNTDHQTTNKQFYLQMGSSATHYTTSVQFSNLSFTTSPYSYTVTRNIDDTGIGANYWAVDSAVVTLGGQLGDGYIELTSTQTIHGQQGPAITLFERNEVSDGTDWDASTPQVQIGELEGYAGYSGGFGLVAGKNLRYAPTDGDNPFIGIVASDDGYTAYNTELKMLSGSQLGITMGVWPGDTWGNSGDPFFAIGDNMAEEVINPGNMKRWTNSLLQFEKIYSPAGYRLTIDGSVLIGDTTGSDIWSSSDDLYANIPHFDPGGGDPEGGDGFYVTNRWLGFFDYDGTSTTWPIQIGRTNDVEESPYAYIGDADGTSYLKYSTDDGLEVKGKITVLDGAPAVVFAELSIDQSRDTWAEGQVIDYEYPWQGYQTSPGYVSVQMYEAEGNCYVHYKSTTGGAYTELGNCHGADDQTRWYSFPVDLVAGVNNHVKIEHKDTYSDGWTIKNIVVTKGGELESDMLDAYIATAGFDDWSDLGDITDDITIGDGGGIIIGNNPGSAISSYGMPDDFSTNNTTAGFRIGRHNDDANYKFLIKNNKNDASTDQQYIKVDTSSSTDSIVVKGNLHADKLANIQPKIFDGVTYQPLTQISSEFDGPLDDFDGESNFKADGGWDAGHAAFTSDPIYVSNVRNGALVQVSIYAEADDYARNDASKVLWFNPRIAYHSKSMDNAGDLPLVSADHWPNGNSNWRLGGNWREVDWVKNRQSMNNPAENIEGIWLAMGEPYNGSDSYWNQGDNNVGLHDDVVAWKDDGLYPPSDNYASPFTMERVRGADSNTMESERAPYIFQFRMKEGLTANARQEAIINQLWAVRWNDIADPDKYYLGTAVTTNGNGDTEFTLVPGAGWDNTGFDRGWRTTDESLIPPAYTSYGLNQDGGMSSEGIKYKLYGHNGVKEDYWQYLTATEGQQMLFRNINADLQTWTDTMTADSNGIEAWSQFRHTYNFYVDIPGLESMTDPGEIQIIFGTGMPFSPYATWMESVGIRQTDFKITVWNQG